MPQKYLYVIWLVLTFLAAVIVASFRAYQGEKWQLKLNEFLDLALAVAGGVSGLFLIFQTWNHYEELQSLVSTEGLVAMALGSLASIWFSVSKVNELAIRG
jgi:hypothetical protein